MAKIPFNVDANTARLIGRQNVAKLDGAIMELIKNAYDADATKCWLYYEASSKSLILADNGCGMDESVILNNWMTIGRSSKTVIHRSKNGRVQTGEKGIGRFALDRIGDWCEMLTMTAGKKLLWQVHWDSFDFGKSITDVTADLSETNDTIEQFLGNIKNHFFVKCLNEYLLESGTGTIFFIQSLRDEWNNAMVNGIKNTIRQLIPGEYTKVFNVLFFEEDTENLDDANLISDNEITNFDYRITFEVKESGEAKIKLLRNEFDFKARFDEIMKGCGFSREDKDYFNNKEKIISLRIQDVCGLRKNIVGEFSGVLYFTKNGFSEKDKEIYFYRDDKFSKVSDIFGGIKLYRDGFRVRPYGDVGTSQYDWLQLSYRKNKSPAAIAHPTGAWRVNAEQMFGSIFISRENSGFEDQANREGIIESAAFFAFQEFIIFVIREFERDRQYVGRKLNNFYIETHRDEDLANALEKKLNSAKKQKNIVINAEKLKEAFDRKKEAIEFLEDENRLLRTLATTGILTNTYIHEIKGLNDKLGLKVTASLKLLQKGDIQLGIQRIEEAQELSNQFSPWFDVTIDTVRQDRRKRKKLSLAKCIDNVASSWMEALKNKNIEIDISGVQDVQFFCFSYEIESIFHNLIANSMASFEAHRVAQKKIVIQVYSDDQKIYIKYADNGAGLSPRYKNHPEKILEAFETDKRDCNGEIVGTGMGMWIINKTVQEYKGEIDLKKNISEEKGFYISITWHK